jgi:hypothetical protein
LPAGVVSGSVIQRNNDIGAYAVYDGMSFAAIPPLGGAYGFAVAILSRHAALDPLWLIELVAACEVFRLLNPLGRRELLN